MAGAFSFPVDYWSNIQITRQDVKSLQAHLFEVETPLTAHDLASVFVAQRIKAEHDARAQQREAAGQIYVPKERYNAGDDLVFPALDWKRGQVIGTRPAVSPELGAFEVMTVTMDHGLEMMFASGLQEHVLNEEPVASSDEDELSVETILEEYGRATERKLESAFADDLGLVQIAGRWFPSGLLVDVSEGQLNLAEAVLDIAQGEPLPTTALLKDVDLPADINPKLAEFSLNYALQDDARFDEVGPAGQVLWCLRRLEPDGVREVPSFLRYTEIPHDRSALDEAMLKLEAQLDDELSEPGTSERKDVKEVTLSLIYPHLRAGTLPSFSTHACIVPHGLRNHHACVSRWWMPGRASRCRPGLCGNTHTCLDCANGTSPTRSYQAAS